MRSTSPVTVALVGCSAQKLERAAPARELYRSPLFRRSLAFARHVLFAQHIFVLSAKHGAVSPDQVLEPYDLALRDFEDWELADWAHVVGTCQLRDAIAPGATFAEFARITRDWRWVLLASDLYLPQLPLCSDVERPLAGKQIGERLAYLNAHLAAVPRELREAA